MSSKEGESGWWRSDRGRVAGMRLVVGCVVDGARLGSSGELWGMECCSRAEGGSTEG